MPSAPAPTPGPGAEPFSHPAAAAERHRQPAHGPRLQPHADGHPRPLAPDARLRRALAARPRPCRHRHADGRRARAGARPATRPPRDGPRGLRRQGLGVEGALRRHHPRAVAPPRRQLRPVAERLHHVGRPGAPARGQLPRRGPQDLRRVLRPRADLPRQAARQLGPALRDGDLRPRGRAGRGQGPPLAPALSAGEGRDLRAPGRLRRGRQADRLRDPRLSRRRHHPPRDHARRHRRRRPPRRPALPHLVGKTVRLPLVGRSIPIVADAYADPEKGTGASRSPPPTTSTTGRSASAPACRRSTSWTPAPASTLTADPAFREGIDPSDELAEPRRLDRYEARDVIVTIAEEQGWLDGIDEELHTVPHGDRSKSRSSPSSPTSGTSTPRRWPSRRSPPSATAARASCPSSTRRPTSTGSRTSSRGASPASSGGATRSRSGTATTSTRRARRCTPRRPRRPPASRRVHQEHGRWLRAFCGVGEDAVREEAENWYRSRVGKRVIVRFEGEPEDEAGEFAEERGTIFVTLRRDPDVLDTWFSSGIWPIGTLGWPEQTPELSATTRPACSSPASTSSSSGSPG